VRQALLDHKVVFLRGQHLSLEEQRRFGQYFGDLLEHPINALGGYPDTDWLEEQGIRTRAENWHSDLAFLENPAFATILSLAEMPPVGGDTLFADLEAAYNGLSQPVRNLVDGLTALHDAENFSDFGWGPSVDAAKRAQILNFSARKVEHPLVKAHPEAGRKTLFAARGFARKIKGLNDEESAGILSLLAAHGAAERDRERRLPWAELDESLASGLWGITIPHEYGGASVRQRVVAEVFRILASGDASLAQIPQNHFEIIDLVRQTGRDAQKRIIFGRVLRGARLGNAFSEFKGKNVEDFQTRIRRQGGSYVVNGEKFCATGALFAHLVPIIAISEDDGNVYAAIAERSAAGLTIIDNWDGFGQRTTASGTVKIENVFVPADYVLPAYIAYDNPSPAGPQSQLLHAAIDLGIAEAAIEKAIELVRHHARPSSALII
jgi:alpha-ketoglutarate-dependent taurine dioxygenase